MNVMLSIVLRVLWNGGVTRIAVEEARRIHSKLLVLRESKNDYDLGEVNFEVMRKYGERSSFTPLLTYLTALYAKDRGTEATVDLDLILKAIKRIKPPALYHDQFSGIIGYIRKKLYGEDYFVYIHETSIDKNITKHSSKWKIATHMIDIPVIKNAKMIFTNSKWNQEVIKKYNLNTVVAYPGCYPKEKINENKGKIVLAVSMWDRGRRPEQYGEIARRLKNGKVVIAGSWADEMYMREFMRSYPAALVTGRISEAKLHELYDTASVILRFGFKEERGPGLGVLEGMANGLIPIVDNDLGAKEFILNDLNGYVVNDWEEALERIELLFSNGGKRKDMARNAWLKSKELTWDNHAKVIKDHLETH